MHSWALTSHMPRLVAAGGTTHVYAGVCDYQACHGMSWHVTSLSAFAGIGAPGPPGHVHHRCTSPCCHAAFHAPCTRGSWRGSCGRMHSASARPCGSCGRSACSNAQGAITVGRAPCFKVPLLSAVHHGQLAARHASWVQCPMPPQRRWPLDNFLPARRRLRPRRRRDSSTMMPCASRSAWPWLRPWSGIPCNAAIARCNSAS